MKKTLTLFVATCVLAATALANDETSTVHIDNAWARATVQGQKASAAFMTLTAKAATTLVGVTTPVAGVAQVHEMKMDGDVMHMRPLANGLPLPAGKPVALTAGGYHIMLMDLKLPLQTDTTIPLTLRFKDAKGTESKLDVKLPVAVVAPMHAER